MGEYYLLLCFDGTRVLIMLDCCDSQPAATAQHSRADCACCPTEKLQSFHFLAAVIRHLACFVVGLSSQPILSVSWLGDHDDSAAVVFVGMRCICWDAGVRVFMGEYHLQPDDGFMMIYSLEMQPILYTVGNIMYLCFDGPRVLNSCFYCCDGQLQLHRLLYCCCKCYMSAQCYTYTVFLQLFQLQDHDLPKITAKISLKTSKTRKKPQKFRGHARFARVPILYPYCTAPLTVNDFPRPWGQLPPWHPPCVAYACWAHK